MSEGSNKSMNFYTIILGTNLTISKMIDIGLALNCKLKIGYKPIPIYDKSQIVYSQNIYSDQVTKKTFNEKSGSYSISNSEPAAYKLTLELP